MRAAPMQRASKSSPANRRKIDWREIRNTVINLRKRFSLTFMNWGNVRLQNHSIQQAPQGRDDGNHAWFLTILPVLVSSLSDVSQIVLLMWSTLARSSSELPVVATTNAPLSSVALERSKVGGRDLLKDLSRPVQVQYLGHRQLSPVALVCWGPDWPSAVTQCGLL